VCVQGGSRAHCFSLFREVFAGRVRSADAVCGVRLEVSGSSLWKLFEG
jgi:hypothetical protein